MCIFWLESVPYPGHVTPNPIPPQPPKLFSIILKVKVSFDLEAMEPSGFCSMLGECVGSGPTLPELSAV